ncbi:MAG: AAA family ATPase [Paludibacteraceae bacterium]|nr:AAA family ATPase [Paludibacteraceae bacterium]
MSNTFSIVAIDLSRQQEGHIRKILKKDIYILDQRYIVKDGHIINDPSSNNQGLIDGLYGENIQVQAIVGRNGSGKSSLIEIIYRIVNNFTYAVLQDAGEQTDIIFVDGLDADLYYQEKGTLYCLTCKGKDISLYKHNSDNTRESIYDSYQQSQFPTQIKLRDISQHLFYTIVTNYAPQSMISNDYACEHEKSAADSSSWMKFLFHKNDGYLAPICLVPFRDVNGAINTSRENELTLHRLSSIFIYYQLKNKESGNNSETLIDGYELGNLHYVFNRYWVNHKISEWTNMKRNLRRITPSSIFRKIVKAYGFYDDKLFVNELYFTGCIYLVLKVLNIIETYPSYSDDRYLVLTKKNYYSGNQHIDMMQSIPSKEREAAWDEVLEKLKDDESHITYKVSQTEKLLKYMQDRNCDERVNWLMDENGFTYDTYLTELYQNGVKPDFEEINKTLPPSFFDLKMKLLSIKENNAEPISFYDLSSGEKQYLCVLGAYIYHILNLQSVEKQKNRAYYNNIMLVMDEVEICFHPDYQRQFINRLVSLIREFQFNKDTKFYILLATHSPFILSDVAKGNILYLKNGEDVSEKIEVNPFCANVNDILAQSFFMEDGFSGEYAIKTVRELIAFLKGDSTNPWWNDDRAKYVTNEMIGDPILRDALRALLKDK